MKTLIKAGLIISIALLLDIIIFVLPLSIYANTMWLLYYSLTLWCIESVVVGIMLLLWKPKTKK